MKHNTMMTIIYSILLVMMIGIACLIGASLITVGSTLLVAAIVIAIVAVIILDTHKNKNNRNKKERFAV